MLLSEGSRDKALEQYLPLLQKRGINASLSQLKQALLKKFVSEGGFQNLSLDSNYYLVGVARYYFNGDLTTNKRLNILYPNVKDKFNSEICKRLNELILILRNAYIDSVGTQFEQPEDFGTLSINQLLRKYNKKINASLGIDAKKEEEQEPKKVSDDYTAGSEYTYEILYSYEDARKYYEATRPGAWCITYGKQHYDGYIKRLGIHYVVFKKNGFENIKRKVGPGFTKRKPHDEYGNSLICVLQSNNSLEPRYITSRWNHGSVEDNTQGTEADHAYTTEEFLNVIGCDKSVLSRVYDQWLDVSKYRQEKHTGRHEQYAKRLGVLRRFKYVQMLVNNGTNPEVLYDNEEYNLGLYALSSITTDFSTIERDKKRMGTYFVSIDVNGETYFSLWDRRKILFDKFLVGGDYIRRDNEKISDNVILIEPGYKKGKYLFDLRRHTFIDVDGIVHFKELSYGNGHACVAMSQNQYALIDLETGKPVRAKNGSPWFERIGRSYYDRSINTPYLKDKGCVQMVYDSAAGEDYIYNLTCHQFVPANYADMYFPPYQQDVDGLIEFMSRTDDRYVSFLEIKTNKPFTINGIDKFEDLEKSGDLVAFKSLGQSFFELYDIATNAFLTLNGEKLTLENKPKIEKPESNESYYIITLDGYNYGKNKTSYLYNPITRKLMHDDSSGDAFRMVPNGLKLMAFAPNNGGIVIDNKAAIDYYTRGIIPANNVIFRKYHTGELVYFVKTPEQDANEQESRKSETNESIKKEFWTVTKRLNEIRERGW